MSGSPTACKDWAALLSRWGIGSLFVYMGLRKALHPEHFLQLVLQYNLVDNPVLLNVIAVALPWLEVFCGLLLLAGVAVRGAALMLLAMLLVFTPIVIRRALEIAALDSKPFCEVKFDCGCGAGEVFICRKVPENVLLILLLGWLLWCPCRRWCARFTLWGEPRQDEGPAQAPR